MSLLGKVVKGVVDVVKDTTKISLLPINQSAKSVTGKDLIKGVTDLDTGVGKVAGGLTKLGVDTGHKALQGYANAVTGGYASVLHEKIVPGIVEKQAEDYNTKIFSSGALSSFEDVTKKAAPIVGSIASKVVGPKGDSAAATKVDTTVTAKVLSSQTDKPVSLISKITTGVSNFSKTSVGTAAVGVLGQMVQNLATPKPSAPVSQVPQALALAYGNMAPIPTTQTAAQKAVFEGKGIQITLPDLNGGNSNGNASGTWWANNKSWALPVLIGVGVLLGLPLLFVLFKFIGKFLK